VIACGSAVLSSYRCWFSRCERENQQQKWGGAALPQAKRMKCPLHAGRAYGIMGVVELCESRSGDDQTLVSAQ